MTAPPGRWWSSGGRFSDLVLPPRPWPRGEALQTELRKAGVRTTLCWGPQERAAQLEVWPGPDEAQVREALARSRGMRCA